MGDSEWYTAPEFPFKDLSVALHSLRVNPGHALWDLDKVETLALSTPAIGKGLEDEPEDVLRGLEVNISYLLAGKDGGYPRLREICDAVAAIRHEHYRIIREAREIFPTPWKIQITGPVRRTEYGAWVTAQVFVPKGET